MTHSSLFYHRDVIILRLSLEKNKPQNRHENYQQAKLNNQRVLPQRPTLVPRCTRTVRRGQRENIRFCPTRTHVHRCTESLTCSECKCTRGPKDSSGQVHSSAGNGNDGLCAGVACESVSDKGICCIDSYDRSTYFDMSLYAEVYRSSSKESKV